MILFHFRKKTISFFSLKFLLVTVLFSLIFLFQFVFFVNAQNQYFEINIKLYDHNNTLIEKGNIDYFLKDRFSGETFNKSIKLNNNFSLAINKEANYYLTILYDDVKTQGKDGFAFIDFSTLNSSKKIYLDVELLPVGSIYGTVHSLKGNILVNAIVRADCVSDYGIQGNTRSNDLGNFFFLYLPEGYCRITSSQDDFIGFLDVNITKGSLKSVKIILENEKNKKNNFISSQFFILLFSVFLVLIILFFLFKSLYTNKFKIKKNLSKSNYKISNRKNLIKINNLKKEDKEDIKIKHENSVQSDNKNIDEHQIQNTDHSKFNEQKFNEQKLYDFMKFLNSNEKEVVNYLIKNDDSSMSKIYYSTGIPKTSLSRVLDSLEAKNVINTQKVGKLKKVKLTQWFKEKIK